MNTFNTKADATTVSSEIFKAQARDLRSYAPAVLKARLFKQRFKCAIFVDVLESALSQRLYNVLLDCQSARQ